MKLINDIYYSTVYVTKVVVPIFYLDSVREQKPKKQFIRFDGGKICETAVQTSINGGETLGATKLAQI